MNQVDLFVFAVVAAFSLSGYRRGLISSAGDIIAIGLALAVGSVAYPPAATALGRLFGLPANVSGPLGYLAVAVAVALATSWGCSALAARFEPPRRVSRAGGAAFGAVLGMVLAGVLVMASGMVPSLAAPVERSALGRSLVQVVPRLHEGMESIGLPLPKLVQLPTDYREEVQGMRQGLQFMRINFTRLDGATCIHCRTPVVFEGYRFSRGTLMSPKFRCPKCGRTSDGCQTFEGFHAIYGKCPVELAEQGVEFDCGVWTNGWLTVPHGRCPVCGRELKGAEAAQTHPTAGLR
jgi:uncharacterized membrane protein required for colicin V production